MLEYSGWPALAETDRGPVAEAFASAYPDLTGSIDVTEMTADEIRQLNRSGRGVDEPTDVLSFPLIDDPLSTDPSSSDAPLLGDIAFCAAEVREHGETITQILVHGTLHLLGFDHADAPLAWKAAEAGIVDELAARGIAHPPMNDL